MFWNQKGITKKHPYTIIKSQMTKYATRETISPTCSYAASMVSNLTF